jgi:Flp pilus assembly protein TadG
VDRAGNSAANSSRQRGAALVEFAIVAPLLILLLFGIVEFGWVLAQFNEVRHAAQEGARWGAVSRPDIDGGGAGSSDLVARACNAANLPSGSTLSVTAATGGGAKGDTATVTVTANIASLTGLNFITVFLPPSLSNTATFRLEQTAAWSAVGPTSC